MPTVIACWRLDSDDVLGRMYNQLHGSQMLVEAVVETNKQAIAGQAPSGRERRYEDATVT